MTSSKIQQSVLIKHQQQQQNGPLSGLIKKYLLFTYKAKLNET